MERRESVDDDPREEAPSSLLPPNMAWTERLRAAVFPIYAPNSDGSCTTTAGPFLVHCARVKRNNIFKRCHTHLVASLSPLVTSFFFSKEAVTAVLNRLTSIDYQGCFQSWEQHWNRCAELKSDYCEGRRFGSSKISCNIFNLQSPTFMYCSVGRQ